MSKLIYKCIANASAAIAVTGLDKTRKNTQQGYNFRGIDDVYNLLAQILPANNIVILPRFVNRTQTERTSAKGSVIFYTIVEAEFDFVCAEDGSMHTVKTFGEAMDSADKSTNKAMSAAYKYACFQTFCIPTEGDNDADQTTHEIVEKSQRQNNEAELQRKQYQEFVEQNLSTLEEKAFAGIDALQKAFAEINSPFKKQFWLQYGDNLKKCASNVGQENIQ